MEIESGKSIKQPLRVGELTRELRDLLQKTWSDVWITGEISNLRPADSGHFYFTLKDEEATLNVVMFRGDAVRLRFAPQDGMAVIAQGAITVYEKRGQYQLQIWQLHPRGQGLLQQRFELLKRKLQLEGLFDLDRKRALPHFPQVIGIVTSLQGAVLHDFLKVLHRRAPGIRIQVRGVRVQGAQAAEEIVEAIVAFNRSAEAETIVIARGGGSLEDLAVFNEEIVARAVAESKIPTLSAVGHETDYTITDFVADLRAPTPSAAAEIISRDWNEWREEILQWLHRLQRAMQSYLEHRRLHWEHLRQSSLFREPKRLVQQAQQRLDDLSESMKTELLNVLQQRRHAFEKVILRWKNVQPKQRIRYERERLLQRSSRLLSLGPQSTLNRGYALVLDSQGKIIRKADSKLIGQEAKVLIAMGSLEVKIKNASDKEFLNLNQN